MTGKCKGIFLVRFLGFVLLDLSAGFDTVDHEVLLRRLEVTYGITGTALQWFRSYLTGRTQRVYINLTYSDDFALPHGVPQGSCLGPLLFKMYAGDVAAVVRSSTIGPLNNRTNKRNKERGVKTIELLHIAVQ